MDGAASAACELLPCLGSWQTLPGRPGALAWQGGLPRCGGGGPNDPVMLVGDVPVFGCRPRRGRLGQQPGCCCGWTRFGRSTGAGLVSSPDAWGSPCLLSLRLERVWSGMKRLWRNYSLSITLAGLFFVSWIGQLVTQWFTWANDQQEHNQPLEVGNFLPAARPLLSPGGPACPRWTDALP